MSSRRQALLLICLLLVAVVSRVLFSRALSSPGIVDAVYYFDVAKSFAEGNGLTSQVVWNYLAPPEKLIHPAHGYWGPLLSFYLAAAFYLFGSSWIVAASAMTLLSLILFGLTLLIGTRLFRSPEIGLLAAAFLVVNVPLTYLSVTTETPVPFAVLVNIALLLLVGAREGKETWWYPSAFIAGLSSLVRNDGLLLCAVVVGFAIHHSRRTRNGKKRFLFPLVVAFCCLAAILPWKGRNLSVFGSSSTVSVTRLLTLSSYDELFQLDPQNDGGFFGVPLGQLAMSKLQGLKLNIQTLVTKEILLLFIFCLPALPTTLRDPRLLPFWIYGLSVIVALGALFPFHSGHGTFFRSMMALYPLLACTAVYGYWRTIDVIHRKIRQQRWRSIVKTSREAGMHALLLVYVAIWVASLQHPNIANFQKLGQSCKKLSTWLNVNAKSDAALISNLSLDVAHYTGHPTAQTPRDKGDEAIVSVIDRYNIQFAVILVMPNFMHRSWGAAKIGIGNKVFKLTKRIPASAPGLQLSEILVYRIGGQ